MWKKWNGPQIVAKVGDIMEKRLRRAAEFLVGQIRKALNQPYPPASRPGQPPHKRTGILASSIAYEIHRAGDRITATVGSHVAYARRLELGFVGTDAAGRNYNQAPRPFIRPTTKANAAAILAILRGK